MIRGISRGSVEDERQSPLGLQTPMTFPISSPILFHCWRHENTDAARLILEAICKNGLLLTTNAKTLDTFEIDRGSGVVQMEVMQHARVCFTDIPFDLLTSHGQRYGRYGIGFRRETVIDWGGLPVWYLPNYWGETLKVAGPVLVNGLHAALDAVYHLQALAKEFREKGVPFSVQYKHGATVQADQLVREMANTASSIFTVLSFIKEMSPRAADDHSYLLEREWRLIAAFGFAGQPLPFRHLTEDEKNLLCSRKPEWKHPRQSEDINITAKYGSTPVVESFRYFNGLPGKDTVAKFVDTILVPNERERQWVTEFVQAHASLFQDGGPNIAVFRSA
jgi:hypothetical protein